MCWRKERKEIGDEVGPGKSPALVSGFEDHRKEGCDEGSNVKGVKEERRMQKCCQKPCFPGLGVQVNKKST